jgi:uncharacterized protein
MSSNQVWLNLPVQNIEASILFFKAIGFTFNEASSTAATACMIVGAQTKLIVMLFEHTQFSTFTKVNIQDNSNSAQMLISIDAQSPQEIDTLVNTITVAGGTIYSAPGWQQGWMYGAGFADLDGHRWNVLYMDMSKMPNQ